MNKLAEEETTDVTDALGERILAEKLAGNRFLLDLDDALKVPDDFDLPAPWNLPSRLFQWPIETHAPRGGWPRTIGLLHPGLAEHPYVKHVESVLGISIPGEPAANDCGYTKAKIAPWWHAVDLATAGLWRELKETAAFTSHECMFRAIRIALDHQHEDAKEVHRALREARDLLAWLGSHEPGNRATSIRMMAKPSVFSDGDGMRCPINSKGREASYEAEAWAFIHGIEDGWMTFDRRGYLQWSELGQKRYCANSDAGFAEASGQHAFAF